jgi:hypothetical protein
MCNGKLNRTKQKDGIGQILRWEERKTKKKEIRERE